MWKSHGFPFGKFSINGECSMVFHIYVSWVLLMEKDPARVGRWFIHVYASGWKTARVVVLLFEYGGWVGWGGILTFMYHAYIRGCYAAATSLVRGWVGWGGILMWDKDVYIINYTYTYIDMI